MDAPPAYPGEAKATSPEVAAPIPETVAPRPENVASPSPEKVTPLMSLSDQPARVDCPNCKAIATTRTTKESGNQAMMCGAILCLLTGCLFAWIPCVMDECKDTRHECETCGRLLATVTSNGGVKVAPGAMTVATQYQRRDDTMTVPTVPTSQPVPIVPDGQHEK